MRRLLNATFGDLKSFESRKPNVSINALMMEVVSTSETSVSFYQTTRRNIQKTVM
jgi:hypothetical protein